MEEEDYEYTSDYDDDHRNDKHDHIPLLESTKKDYICVPLSQMKQRQHNMINKLVEILNIEYDQVLLLLILFKWSEEKFMEYVERDPNFLITLGLVPKNKIEQHKVDQHFCKIMYKYSPNYNTLECGHSYSVEGWNMYLLTKLQTLGEQCLITRCPEEHCDHIISVHQWRSTLSNISSILVDKYNMFLIDSYIHHDLNMKRCTNCEHIFVRTNFVKYVKCDQCLHERCFNCDQLPHYMVTCQQMAIWDEKCRDGAFNNDWIILHTKKCPKCLSFIEKDKGCNHMTCINCQHEFCWVCLQKWSSHGLNYYECNFYKRKGSGKDGSLTIDEINEEQNESEIDQHIQEFMIDKYIFYYDRYVNQIQSMRFADRDKLLLIDTSYMININTVHSLLESVKCDHKVMLHTMQLCTEYNNQDYNCLIEALDQISLSRNVLKYTYIYGYFLDSMNQRLLLELTQKMLESHTEQLHDMIENALEVCRRIKKLNDQIDQIDHNSLFDSREYVNIMSTFTPFDAQNVKILTSSLKKYIQQIVDSF